jgi:hypothetical protein
MVAVAWDALYDTNTQQKPVCIFLSFLAGNFPLFYNNYAIPHSPLCNLWNFRRVIPYVKNKLAKQGY